MPRATEPAGIQLVREDDKDVFSIGHKAVLTGKSGVHG
jgi:hypothetical protein